LIYGNRVNLNLIIIRDIPANYIKAGSRRSSLRQDVQIELKKRGQRCRCIRCREVRGTTVDTQDLIFEDYIYNAAFAEEHFLNYSTSDDRLAGYLRLAIPSNSSDPIFSSQRKELFALIPELESAALIREVHIYGQSLAVGSAQIGAAQHSGLGTTLLKKAEQIAKKAGFSKLVVIAAIGTRLYYKKRGFIRSGLYMTKEIV
jgi:elongator complex protein 3